MSKSFRWQTDFNTSFSHFPGWHWSAQLSINHDQPVHSRENDPCQTTSFPSNVEKTDGIFKILFRTVVWEVKNGFSLRWLNALWGLKSGSRRNQPGFWYLEFAHPFREHHGDVKSVRIPKHCQHPFFGRNRPIDRIKASVVTKKSKLILKIFWIKLILVTSNNVVLLIVLLSSQRGQRVKIPTDSNRFQIVRENMWKSMPSSQNAVNSWQICLNCFRRDPKIFGNSRWWDSWVVSQDGSNSGIGLVSARSCGWFHFGAHHFRSGSCESLRRLSHMKMLFFHQYCGCELKFCDPNVCPAAKIGLRRNACPWQPLILVCFPIFQNVWRWWTFNPIH
jgi:hypothetical protein